MKVSNIVNGVTALQKLNNIDMPINMALTVKKNSDECQQVLKIFEEKRNTIMKELPKDKEVPSESIKAIENHLEEDIELNIKKLSLTALKEAEIKLAPSDITNLEWMIDFDDI